LLVDKPIGPTSFGVVKRVRRATGVKKVGHVGTLDPMAAGLLILCLGRATKLVPFLQTGDKEYTGQILLGLTTDTDDVTGRATRKWAGPLPSIAEIKAASHHLIGAVDQVPPAFSAVKINGRPAYQRARRGEKVRIKSRVIQVRRFDVLEVDPPVVAFRAVVSKGAYIRSLAADLGRMLGVGATLKALTRTASAPFTLNEAVSLPEIEDLAASGRLGEKLLPLDEALSFLPAVVVPEEMAPKVANGRPLPANQLTDFPSRPGPVRVKAPGTGLLAVYEYDAAGEPQSVLTPLKILSGAN
jgi:tRNA pseudouridine55 synthase